GGVVADRAPPHVLACLTADCQWVGPPAPARAKRLVRNGATLGAAAKKLKAKFEQRRALTRRAQDAIHVFVHGFYINADREIDIGLGRAPQTRIDDAHASRQLAARFDIDRHRLDADPARQDRRRDAED